MKPLIGLTPQYDYERKRIFIVENYIHSIVLTGGIPVLLPLHGEEEDFKALSHSLDGFLFTGGPDIDPITYEEETMEACGVIVPERDKMETTLFSYVYPLGKPILGICRGIQVMNVCLGGTLYQDLSQVKDTIAHYQKSENHVLTHFVITEQNSLLHKITGNREFRVNSFHHQVIKDVAHSLQVSATSKDGCIEAVEDSKHKFLMGVQWHPEHLTTFDPNAYRLFSSFIEACKR